MSRKRLTKTLVMAALALASCCGKQAVVQPSQQGVPPNGVVARDASVAVPAGVAPSTVVMPEPATWTADPARAGKSLYQLPHVTLVAVTDWQATLKPCGCTMDLQRGGIERIAKWVGDLRQQDDSLMVVHAGSCLFDAEAKASPAKLAQLQMRAAAFGQALAQLQTTAVAVSQWDLQQGGESTRKAYESLGCAVLATGAAGGPAQAVPLVVRATASGIKVGLLAVDQEGADIATLTADVGARVQQARREGAQVVVLLSHLGLRMSRKLVRQVAGIDVVVAGQLDERATPLMDLEREGDTLLVHSGRHGAWFAALTLVPDGSGGWRDTSAYLPGEAEQLRGRLDALRRHIDEAKARGGTSIERALPYYQAQLDDLGQRVAQASAAQATALPAGRLAAFRAVGLDWSAAVDERVAALVQAYERDAAAAAVQLAAQPVPLPSGAAGYLGQQVCLGCHAKTAQFAQTNPHAHAWQTLVRDKKTQDLDCVPCHVTGWGKPGGSAFDNLKQFHNVQCEACHGPGSLHVASISSGRGIVKPPTVTASACLDCHTPQHSTRFEFDVYRKRLRVPGHGLPLGGGAP